VGEEQLEPLDVVGQGALDLPGPAAGEEPERDPGEPVPDAQRSLARVA